MDTARINDVDIAYSVRGSGEPLLLIHGAFIADGLVPLIDQPALEGFSVIRYHRRGYGDSTGEATPDMGQHVADARALLEHLDALPAHIVGHSYGGAVALQLAADSPDAVRSLTLLEAGLATQIPSAERVGEGMQRLVQPFVDGDAEKATHQFLRAVLGWDYRQMVEYNVGPNALPQAFADADDGFAGDLQSLMAWTFGEQDAAKIKCPTLLVLGGLSDETFCSALDELGIDAADLRPYQEITDVLRTWIPHSDVVTLGELNHALQMQDAFAVGVALAPFLSKHRAAVPARS